MGLVLYIFLIYGYRKGFIPDILFPSKIQVYRLNLSFNPFGDQGIRYGIILSPFILLFTGILASRNKILWSVCVMLFGAQIFINVYKPQLLQYSLPILWHYPAFPSVSWFRSHYTGGLILTSANKHEDFIFQTGLPYKDFIYEGNRKYWTDSLNNPAKYAAWVVKDSSKEDSINIYLTSDARVILKTRFELVYNKDGLMIYHKLL